MINNIKSYRGCKYCLLFNIQMLVSLQRMQCAVFGVNICWGLTDLRTIRLHVYIYQAHWYLEGILTIWSISSCLSLSFSNNWRTRACKWLTIEIRSNTIQETFLVWNIITFFMYWINNATTCDDIENIGHSPFSLIHDTSTFETTGSYPNKTSKFTNLNKKIDTSSAVWRLETRSHYWPCCSVLFYFSLISLGNEYWHCCRRLCFGIKFYVVVNFVVLNIKFVCYHWSWIYNACTDSILLFK